MANQVIRLLFGVQGGDNISVDGTSGGLIRKDIESICKAIADKKHSEIDFSVSSVSLENMKKAIREAAEEALKDLEVTYKKPPSSGAGGSGSGGKRGSGNGGSSGGEDISDDTAAYMKAIRHIKEYYYYLGEAQKVAARGGSKQSTLLGLATEELANLENIIDQLTGKDEVVERIMSAMEGFQDRHSKNASIIGGQWVDQIGNAARVDQATAAMSRYYKLVEEAKKAGLDGKTDLAEAKLESADYYREQAKAIIEVMNLTEDEAAAYNRRMEQLSQEHELRISEIVAPHQQKEREGALAKQAEAEEAAAKKVLDAYDGVIKKYTEYFNAAKKMVSAGAWDGDSATMPQELRDMWNAAAKAHNTYARSLGTGKDNDDIADFVQQQNEALQNAAFDKLLAKRAVDIDILVKKYEEWIQVVKKATKAEMDGNTVTAEGYWQDAADVLGKAEDARVALNLSGEEAAKVEAEVQKMMDESAKTAEEYARKLADAAIARERAAQEAKEAAYNKPLQDATMLHQIQQELLRFSRNYATYSREGFLKGDELAEFQSRAEKIAADLKQMAGSSEEFEKNFANLSVGSVVELLRNIQGLNKEMSNNHEEASRAEKDNVKLANSYSKLANRAQDYLERIRKTLQRNPAKLKELENLIEKLNTPGSFKTVVEASAAFQKLQLEIKQAGLETETLWQTVNRIFKEKFGYGVMASLAMEARSALKLVYQNVVQLDAKMTELQIVSGATWREMAQIMDGAAEAAKRVASSITDIVDATTVYRRLGFANTLALDFAELTTMYSKVGGVEMAEAESSVTSIIKAFGLEDVDDLKLAMDQLIMVGNNFAISSGELGQGLQNSGSALMAAGNTFTESLAILTSANNVVQDISKASTAMRTISARLRQSNAELQELGEDALSSEYDTTSKYRAKLLAITGVDILEDDMKTFRSTYDILKDIAAVWDSLQDIDRAAVTEMIGGVRNQNIVASLMTSYGDAEKVMSVTANAAGSMAKAYESYTDSIQGRTNTMIATFQELSTNILDSDLIKAAITGVTELISLVNKLVDAIGLVAPAIAGVGIYQFIKSVGGAKMIALKSAPTYVPVVTRNEYAA